MKNFTQTVQQHKAIEYLIQNDPTFRSIAYRMANGTPVEAARIALECATWLANKVKDIAPQMDVSEKEKREGYPLST